MHGDGTLHDDSLWRAQNRERAQFYKTYYGPLGANSLHGLAIVDTISCSVLYANARFLASHGLAPNLEMPALCAAVHGRRSAACGDGDAPCPAMVGAKKGVELRLTEARPGGDGLPARTAEIVVIPLTFQSQFGRRSEVLLVEKEQAQAAPTPHESEQEYHAAVARHSADAILGLGLDKKVRFWNRGAEELFGYSAEEAIGQDYSFLVPDTDVDRQEYQQLTRDFDKRGLVKNQQARRRTRDQRMVVVNLTRSLVLDAAGHPRGSSEICRDVTLEVLLRELIEHQLRAMNVIHEIGDLLHSTHSVDEILRLILTGVTAGQGLGFNRAFMLLVEDEDKDGGVLAGRLAIGPSTGEEASRIWNKLSKEPVALPDLYSRYEGTTEGHDVLVNSIVHSFRIPMTDESHPFVRSIKSRRAKNVIRGRLTDENKQVDAALCAQLQSDSFAIVPLNTREKPIGVLIVDNLITGLPVTEADLQMLKVFANHAGIALENSRLRANLERRVHELDHLTRRMQETQARLLQSERLSVIGEMAARIAHEVRNPLVSIGGFARLVRKGISADDPRSDYLRVISDEVARLERIVQGLLDYSRPQQTLDLLDVDVPRLVHEIAAMTRLEAETHGVTIVERFDPALKLVHIDGDKVRQVLLNLIRNSLDAMMREGQVVVETALVGDDRFRITVADNGPGIPLDKRERVFEPGFTTRQHGTGFGLAISKRLIESQGGQISLRSDVLAGCTFDIVLPRRVHIEGREPPRS